MGTRWRQEMAAPVWMARELLLPVTGYDTIPGIYQSLNLLRRSITD